MDVTIWTDDEPTVDELVALLEACTDAEKLAFLLSTLRMFGEDASLVPVREPGDTFAVFVAGAALRVIQAFHRMGYAHV